MTAQELKVYENRIRRAAERQGLRLEKSRRRDHRAPDYGKYRLLAADGEVHVGHGNGASLRAIDLALGGDK